MASGALGQTPGAPVGAAVGLRTALRFNKVQNHLQRKGASSRRHCNRQQLGPKESLPSEFLKEAGFSSSLKWGTTCPLEAWGLSERTPVGVHSSARLWGARGNAAARR